MQPTASWHGADPDAPDFRDTLHARYRQVRREAAVSFTPRGEWRLVDHADCERLLRSRQVGVRTADGRLPHADESQGPRLAMLEQDPPEHGRIRKLVARYFTPRAMAELEARIVARSRELVGAMEPGEVDVVGALADPLPTWAICELVGVPLEDRVRFSAWTREVIYLLLGTHASPEKQARAQGALVEMTAWIRERVDARRGAPSDDLIGVLLEEEGGDRLSEPELIWNVLGLILAGFETTHALIGNGLRRLLLEPDQLARLRADRALLPSAVDECLRYDPPVASVRRYLHAPMTFGGLTLPAGSAVSAVVAAANRDPAVFEDPDRFDVGRTPNPHLSFGSGRHICLGAHLARLEGRAALAAVLDRFEHLELVDPEPHWADSLAHAQAELRVRAR